MSIVLNSAGGGSVTINEPNTASNRTLTLPDNTGNLISTADSGTVTPTMLSQKLTLETAKASTSGTNIDFTGIPSWAKRITVMFNGTSLSGTANILIRVGTASGIVSSGYSMVTGSISTTSASTTNFSTGFGLSSTNASNLLYGSYVLSNVTGNIWVCTGVIYNNTTTITYGGGGVDAGGVLTTIRCTNNGSDTFDAGSINVMYEG